MTEIANISDKPLSTAERAVPRKNLVYDVGLHRGEDTAFYLAMGFDVVAFEANPDLAAMCRKRFVKEIADERLIIVEGAISEPGSEQIEFYRDPQFSVWGTTGGEWVSRRENLADFERVSVRAIDFSEALRIYGIPHFMKIDIEGADRLCLDALATAATRPHYLSIESEKFSFDALRQEFDLLEALGYKRFAVVQQANIHGRILRTTDRLGKPLEYRFEQDASGAFGVDVGPWVDRAAAMRSYRSIFRAYRMFGEGSWLRRFRIGRIVLARAPRYTGRSLPGWYDTHAMLVE